MPTDPFYELLAQAGFTVLGFWMAVAQLRHADLLRSPGRRRWAHAVSLQFALPAVMSLLALAAPDDPVVWRTSFVVAAAFGAGALLALRVTRPAGPAGPRAPWPAVAASWTALALYLGVALVALEPRALGRLGLGISPLAAEGVLLSLLVFLGLNVAFWLLFSPDGEPAA